MKRFDNILKDIKEVKIQGATNIAKAGIKAFLMQPTEDSAKAIINTRPTEPLLQNSIKFLLNSQNQKKTAKKILDYIEKSNKKISNYGKNLIKKDMNVFSHCHSSTVINILKQAKKKKKNFVVYTTEVEPLLQGRQTAEDLAKAKIKVIVFPDLAAEQAIKKCDIVLFGADAFTKRFAVNKIGTSTICNIATDNNIPTYSAGISLKFTKKVKMEFRKESEVWNEKNKNIDIVNPAFDKIPKKLITGVISEFGILNYKDFAKKAKQKTRC